MRYFETRFLEEADGFISGLDPKTIKKIFYNIDLAEQTNDPKLLNPDYAIEITFSNLTFDSLSLITSFHFSPVEK
jgi:hypothetical protein